MSRFTIDSGTNRTAGASDGGAEPPGVFTGLLGAVLSFFSACKSAASLAMMSERELDDVGLLPWEIQSEIDGGADDRAAIRRFRPPVPCNQA